MLFNVERSSRNPVIVPNMDDRMGDNINGASVIEVPGWIEDPLGRFYMYFSHHEGKYIRLAYADHPEGPWTTYEPGALTLENSTFPVSIDEDYDSAREVPENTDWATPHIASPDVHVDADKQEIRMYFHGLLRGVDHLQTTCVALSKDGLNFDVIPCDLGPAYFRVFRWQDAWYAWTMPGAFFRSPDGLAPFAPDPSLPKIDDTVPRSAEQRRADGQRYRDALRFPAPSRHAAVLVDGNTLYIAFSTIGDTPERIKVTTIDLDKDWSEWQAGKVHELLAPKHDYEGADLPPEKAVFGAIIGRRANGVRDPALLRHDTGLWLYYSLAGEYGIGVAKLEAT